MNPLFERAMRELRSRLKLGRITWAANPPMPGSVFDERCERHDHEWPRMDLGDLSRDELRGTADAGGDDGAGRNPDAQ